MFFLLPGYGHDISRIIAKNVFIGVIG